MEYTAPLCLYIPLAQLLCCQHQNQLQKYSDDLLHNKNYFINLKHKTKMHSNTRCTYYILKFLLAMSSIVLKHIFFF